MHDGDPREIALGALLKLGSHRADARDDWLKVGMALHAASPDLLEAWDDWSKQSEKYRPGECARQWRSFKSDKGVGIGTLIRMAQQDSGDSSIGSAVATVARPSTTAITKPKNHQKYPTLDEAINAAAHSAGGMHVDSWPYEYADGTLAMWVMRFDLPTVGDDGKPAKQFRPIHEADDGWKLGDPPGELPLYGLTKLSYAEPINVFEGEKWRRGGRISGHERDHVGTWR